MERLENLSMQTEYPNGWFEVSGDVDDFIFFEESYMQSEK